MNCMLTNDDGIDAPGLRALEEAVKSALSPGSHPVIAAPHHEHSACGHTATLKSPISVDRESDRRFRIHGTPVDCVRLGLLHLAPETELVVSGINPGGNLGVDLYMSGTVAAVREAAILGRRAIAVSHYVQRLPLDWEAAGRRLRPVLSQILSLPHVPGEYWSVNLPHPDHDREVDAVFCPAEPAPLKLKYEQDGQSYVYAADYHARGRTPGHDVDVCFGGRIAVTRLRVTGA